MPKIAVDNREVYLGIDPGASGGIAAICPDDMFMTAPASDTEREIWNTLRYFQGQKCFATIEQVGGFVGGAGQPGSAMFKFGMSYGALRMALTAADIPFEPVTPQRWQKGLSIPKRGKDESKTIWKNRLKAKAQQLFPSVSVTLAIADALLIAEYCRRKRQGVL